MFMIKVGWWLVIMFMMEVGWWLLVSHHVHDGGEMVVVYSECGHEVCDGCGRRHGCSDFFGAGGETEKVVISAMATIPHLFYYM